MSLSPGLAALNIFQVPDCYLELCFLSHTELFSILLFLFLKKDTKKRKLQGWSNNLERWTGNFACLLTYLTSIYFISCLLQISGICITNSGLRHLVCVVGNLHIGRWYNWPRKVFVCFFLKGAWTALTVLTVQVDLLLRSILLIHK